MFIDQLFEIAERAKMGERLSADDKAFLRDQVPAEFGATDGELPGGALPSSMLPKRIRHPGGFSVSGAPVRTFTNAALLVAARRAFGDRYGKNNPFYDTVERAVAFGIMRDHFHHGHPKGTFCCAPCTLAILTVLRAGTIRWFDCAPVLADVERLVREKQWPFQGKVDPKIIEWAMG